MGVDLKLAAHAGNLARASGITLALLAGMVFSLVLAVLLILDQSNPLLGLGISLGVTVLVNSLVFFLAPWVMDWMQSLLYHTRWVSLTDISKRSPEAGRVIQWVCQQHRLQTPRLGIIADDNPTAFTYGSLPNQARIVVSQGLFKYLEDDEAAAVYAHELGHIVHWDFALMTLAQTLVQALYLIYVYARTMLRGDGKGKAAIQNAAVAAYVFYVIGTYLILYLSRVREYFADHFAAGVTGNPNGLAQALVKIAYGIVQESQHQKEPSRLLEGTRALGIYDPKAAAPSGTVYRIGQDPQQVGRVFLWDLFNPWAGWMELNSTHPLTGKRIRALSTYAEQMGLEAAFDMGRIVAVGQRLDRQRLYQGFALDITIYLAAWLGLALGAGIGWLLFGGQARYWSILGVALIGWGLGLLLKTLVMYPQLGRPAEEDVLTLMTDPYASPLRGRPVQLTGNLIGRGDSGYVFGSDLKLQDQTGLLLLRYASRFGPLGNFLFGASQVEGLIGQSVQSTGWFRRSVMAWLELEGLRTPGRRVASYPRFWNWLLGLGAILGGLVVMAIG